MKNILRYIPRPDTLIGQLSLSLFISLAALFIVNITVVCAIQTHFLTFIEKERATNIASFYGIFSQLNTDKRSDMLDMVQKFTDNSKNSFTLFLSENKPQWDELQQDVNIEQVKNAKQAIHSIKDVLTENKFHPLPQIYAKIFPYGDDAFSKNNPAQFLEKFTIFDKNILQVALQLDEKTWLYITQPLFISIQQLVWAQRGIFLIEFILFSMIALFLVKKYLTPFQKLSKAADIIGKQPEISAPIPEEGCKEIREAARSFNRMQSRIQNNLAERNRMLSAMAHDLRTPLTRAQLRIEDVTPLALRHKLTEDIKEVSKISKQSLELATSLTTTEKSESFDCVGFIQNCADDMCALGHDVRLTTKTVPNPLMVLAKPLSLKRCIDNLLNNAVVYGKNAQIDISCNDTKVFIDIIDSGDGIPKEFLERVFEPYFRLETSRNRDSGGSGLGLSIVKNLLLLNNATIELQNSTTGGLHVHIALPRCTSTL